MNIYFVSFRTEKLTLFLVDTNLVVAKEFLRCVQLKPQDKEELEVLKPFSSRMNIFQIFLSIERTETEVLLSHLTIYSKIRRNLKLTYEEAIVLLLIARVKRVK